MTIRKMIEKAASTIVRRDLVGGLLADRPFDQGDHPVEEALARLGGDLDDDPVGQDAGAAGHARVVAARLADHRGALACDRRLVDRGDPLDDLAVGRDHLTGLDGDEVAGLELRRGDDLPVVASRGRWSRNAGVSWRVARRLSAWALPRASARASAKLANRTVSSSRAVSDGLVDDQPGGRVVDDRLHGDDRRSARCRPRPGT